MYYEINIALNGKHFFATDGRSITDAETFLKVFDILNKKFPEEEGYILFASYNPERSTVVFRSTILDKLREGTRNEVYKLFEND